MLPEMLCLLLSHHCLRTEPRSPECAAVEFPWPVPFMDNSTSIQDRKPTSCMAPAVAGVWVMLSRCCEPRDENHSPILLTFMFSPAAATEATLKNRNNNCSKGSFHVLLDHALCHVIIVFGNLGFLVFVCFCTLRKLVLGAWAGAVGWGMHTSGTPWYPWSDLQFVNFSWGNAWKIETRLQIFEFRSF